jgi:lysophospholipase L1-like esterase
VVAHHPGVVSLLIGTNDPAEAIPLATTQANITVMLDKNRGAGAVTHPHNPAQDADDTARKNFRIQLNNWIKTLAFGNDVIVADSMPLVVPATGNFAVGASHDAVHFGALGAEKIGRKIADVLTPLLPAWNHLPSSPSDPDNFVIYGWMVGDGGDLPRSYGLGVLRRRAGALEGASHGRRQR